jgi:hypothetical protein
VLELQRTAVGGYDLSLADTHTAMADLYMERRAPGAAAMALSKAVTIQTLALGPDSPEVGHTLVQLSTATRFCGNAEAAKSAARRGLLVLSDAHGNDHPEVSVAQVALGDLARDAGNLQGALDNYRLAQRTLAASGEGDSEAAAMCAWSIAAVYASQGSGTKASAEMRDVVATLTKQLGPDHPKTKAAKGFLAHLEEKKRQEDGYDPQWAPKHEGHPWNRWEAGL